MPCYSIDGVIPVVHPSSFVHPTATLIGDVLVGRNSYIGPGASLRGDFGRIELMDGVNIQDGCVLHGFPDQMTIVEENGHIGHSAILHGCRIGRNALVGMNAVVMDAAIIGEWAIVAACALVPASMNVPARTLIAGLPAKIIRQLTDEELTWKDEGTQAYHVLTERSMRTMIEVKPLAAVDAQRPSLQAPDIRSLAAIRAAAKSGVQAEI